MADSSFAVLNLGSQRVSAAVFNKGRNGELILKAFEVTEMHGDPSAEATRLPQLRVALVELSEKLKLKGKTVYYAIAGHVVFTRFVKLPPFDEDKADQIVEFEARQNVPFPINEVIWDYEFIGSKDSMEREVALVAIKADALNDINDQVESVGIKVAAVDLAPLAVFNAFRYTYPDVDETSLIIDLGARSTNLIFVEGERVFTRNILVGGSTVTGNVGKELGMNFAEAEDQKRARGYVAPGGAYEPNDDEVVEAMSKIMRNTMTRLHGEIVRTVNYYRSQQGGSPPRRFFLCGGGAQTPLAVDFFQEKFNLPVEVLNPLRGVTLDRGVSQQVADAQSPAMMELVGLGLRHAGACPVEVELLPDSVAAARDSAKRMPFLILATVCLFALLGLAGFYFSHAASVVEGKLVESRSLQANLQRDDDTIKDWDKQLQLLRGQSGQLEQAINDRGYWKGLLAVLNNQFETDFVWLTQLEVLKNGSSITPALTSTAGTTPVAAPKPPTPPATTTAPGAPPAVAYALRFQGLYRKNDEGGQQVVYKYYEALKKDDKLFGAVTAEEKPDVDSGIDDERYAYQFKFRLPLVNGMKFEK
ncbi:type IV pilus assembly protein PilM [Phragmitibacter flavus]|uniref:Type IV pilus assembly protein PilM n=1 Tax=Phragmitibacter flavus TaxID=2576071 RepID=A0A5R8KGY2_9BACT|nr:type IV pilus assembly protein PilM [Phragmitibacter flavus]TLD71574.1 type IV pilus assembly protein PilM [Phragmitibacter flavus]